MGDAREIGPDGIGIEVRPLGDEKKNTKARTETRCGRRRSKRRGVVSDDSEGDDEWENTTDSISQGEEHIKAKKHGEYEFVNLINGEESRASNGSKGLDRGPFVFWTI